MRVFPVRVLESMFYAGIVLYLLSCGQKVPDEETKKIIGQCLKYPQPVFNLTHAGLAGSEDVPRFMEGIEKLAAEGYIKEDRANPSNNVSKTYLPTDRSRDFMTGIYIRDSFAVYDGAVCRQVIKRIDKIAVEKDRVMTVEFTTGYEPIEPYYSLLCINDNCGCFGEKMKKEESRTATLKRDEKGWEATP